MYLQSYMLVSPIILLDVLMSLWQSWCVMFYYHSRLFSRGQDVVEDRSLPDELLFGRVGYLFALNFVQHHLGSDCVDQDLLAKVSLCDFSLWFLFDESWAWSHWWQMALIDHYYVISLLAVHKIIITVTVSWDKMPYLIKEKIVGYKNSKV